MKDFSSSTYQALVEAKKLGGPWGEAQIKAVLKREFEAALKEMKGAKRPKTSQMTDEEWIVSLEGEPSLKGINIRQEIGRAQFWCKQNKRVPTRRFLVNWMNKAERVVDLKALGATHATGLKIPPPAGPDGWREWLKTEMDLLSPEAGGYSQAMAAFLNHQFSMLPASWQARCRTQLAAFPQKAHA